MLIYGFPTTGKSYLINLIMEKNPFRIVIDTDKIFEALNEEVFEKRMYERKSLEEKNTIDRIYTLTMKDIYPAIKGKFDVWVTNLWRMPADIGFVRTDMDYVRQIMDERNPDAEPHKKEVVDSWKPDIHKFSESIKIIVDLKPGEYMADYFNIDKKSISINMNRLKLGRVYKI